MAWLVVGSLNRRLRRESLTGRSVGQTIYEEYLATEAEKNVPEPPSFKRYSVVDRIFRRKLKQPLIVKEDEDKAGHYVFVLNPCVYGQGSTREEAYNDFMDSLRKIRRHRRTKGPIGDFARRLECT